MPGVSSVPQWTENALPQKLLLQFHERIRFAATVGVLCFHKILALWQCSNVHLYLRTGFIYIPGTEFFTGY